MMASSASLSSSRHCFLRQAWLHFLPKLPSSATTLFSAAASRYCSAAVCFISSRGRPVVADHLWLPPLFLTDPAACRSISYSSSVCRNFPKLQTLPAAAQDVFPTTPADSVHFRPKFSPFPTIPVSAPSSIVKCKKQSLPFITSKSFSTYESQATEGLIPPELLKGKTILTPDRVIGKYQDLITGVTNFQNEDKGYMALAGDVFDVPIRKDIIHRVVRWQLAKRQQGTHSTKTLSEVSGTGKKPYKQKGTGRARHGTLRGPQFRGGCTMHGPKPRSHAIKLQKKVRRLGLKIALSARVAEGKLLVFEDLTIPSHKTKNIANYVSQMESAKKVLLVNGGVIDGNLKLATKNLHYVNVLPSIGLNVYSILQHDTLVMTRDAVDTIVTRMHTRINR